MKIYSVQARNYAKPLNFTARMDESAYLKIRQAYPDFKLPKGVNVVADDLFEKAPVQKKKPITASAPEPKKEQISEDDYDPIYDDPNYHGYTEYGTFPTNRELAERYK